MILANLSAWCSAFLDILLSISTYKPSFINRINTMTKRIGLRLMSSAITKKNCVTKSRQYFGNSHLISPKQARPRSSQSAFNPFKYVALENASKQRCTTSNNHVVVSKRYKHFHPMQKHSLSSKTIRSPDNTYIYIYIHLS